MRLEPTGDEEEDAETGASETVDLDLPDAGAQSATPRERADRGMGAVSYTHLTLPTN